MTLKACVVANEISIVETVIRFAKHHNYLLRVDDETVWYVVFMTQPNESMDSNYKLMRLLI